MVCAWQRSGAATPGFVDVYARPCKNIRATSVRPSHVPYGVALAKVCAEDNLRKHEVGAVFA